MEKASGWASFFFGCRMQDARGKLKVTSHKLQVSGKRKKIKDKGGQDGESVCVGVFFGCRMQDVRGKLQVTRGKRQETREKRQERREKREETSRQVGMG